MGEDKLGMTEITAAYQQPWFQTLMTFEGRALKTLLPLFHWDGAGPGGVRVHLTTYYAFRDRFLHFPSRMGSRSVESCNFGRRVSRNLSYFYQFILVCFLLLGRRCSLVNVLPMGL